MIFRFIQKEVEIEKSSQIVEVMDNWEHGNSYVINFVILLFFMGLIGLSIFFSIQGMGMLYKNKIKSGK